MSQSSAIWRRWNGLSSTKSFKDSRLLSIRDSIPPVLQVQPGGGGERVGGGFQVKPGSDVYGAYVLSHFSCVWLCVILSTEACQDLLSMGFSRQEYWSGLPFPPPCVTLFAILDSFLYIIRVWYIVGTQQIMVSLPLSIKKYIWISKQMWSSVNQ